MRLPTCAVAASCSRGAAEAEAPLALVSRPSGEACSRLSSATRTLSPASARAVDSSWERVREGFSERGGEGSVRSIADRRHLKRYGIRQLQFDKGAEPNEQRTLLLALNNVKRIHAHDFPIISGELPGGLASLIPLFRQMMDLSIEVRCFSIQNDGRFVDYCGVHA